MKIYRSSFLTQVFLLLFTIIVISLFTPVVTHVHAQAAPEIWVTNKNNTLSRFYPDKTIPGSAISGNGLNQPYDISSVGSEIWAVNSTGNSISRFNADGTSAGSTITGNGLNFPSGIVVASGQVWVTNANANSISLFNLDGTAAGTISGNGLNHPVGMTIAGSQVWVTNATGNTISRFNVDGTTAGVTLSGNGLNSPLALGIVNSEVWVVNGNGNSISRFWFDGTISNPNVTGNGMNKPAGILQVNSYVWVTNITSNAISVFDTDGVAVGTPITGNGLNAPAMLRYNNTQSSFSGVGNIVNLNFGINNSYPWIQSVCGDLRMDNGVVNKPSNGLPTIATNATCPAPGIIYTGNVNPVFGNGTSSSSNQIVGGNAYPEIYTPSGAGGIFSSYTYLNQKAHSGGLVPTDLASVCTLSNCNLPNNLAKGIYTANGNVTLNSNKFLPNRSYIFLINGTLTLNGDMTLQPNAYAFFSASGNIIIPAAVGSAVGVATANLQGIYSTDKSLVLQSNNNCSDLTLNIEGTVIVNAGRTGGALQNNRNLCASNYTTPTMRITQRLDYVLAIPDFVKIQKVTSQEVNP